MSRRPRPSGAMHVVTNRREGTHREYVTHLLRRSYREGGKVKNETLANLSHLPDELIELIRGRLPAAATSTVRRRSRSSARCRRATSGPRWRWRAAWSWDGCLTARRAASAIYAWR